MRGRKRLSEEDLALKGTKRADRHDNRLKVEPLEKMPAPPDDLTDAAQKVWVSTCLKLLRLKILSEQDTDLIEQYAIAVVTARDAAYDIHENGFSLENDKGTRYTNPAVATLKQAQSIIMAVSDRFGFSPYARQKLKAGPGEKKKVDPLAELLGSSKKN